MYQFEFEADWTKESEGETVIINNIEFYAHSSILKYTQFILPAKFLANSCRLDKIFIFFLFVKKKTKRKQKSLSN